MVSVFSLAVALTMSKCRVQSWCLWTLTSAWWRVQTLSSELKSVYSELEKVPRTDIYSFIREKNLVTQFTSWLAFSFNSCFKNRRKEGWHKRLKGEKNVEVFSSREKLISNRRLQVDIEDPAAERTFCLHHCRLWKWVRWSLYCASHVTFLSNGSVLYPTEIKSSLWRWVAWKLL